MTRLLDHGYVRVVETWGSDERIVESARMSTGKGFLGWDPGPCDACAGTGRMETEALEWVEAPEVIAAPVMRLVSPEVIVPPVLRLVGGRKELVRRMVDCLPCNGKGQLAGDARLLKFLYEHRHDSPFEFAGMIVEVQAPIMVYREWHRHRTQAYQEMSARYVPLPADNYMPTPERCLMVGGSNKQAGAAAGADALTHEGALEWLESLGAVYELGELVYQDGLRRGIPKELARLPVPVGRYSRMRAQAVLRNWLAFLTLRSERNPGAQWEIRQFGNVMGDLLTEHFPRTLELFAGGTR